MIPIGANNLAVKNKLSYQNRMCSLAVLEKPMSQINRSVTQSHVNKIV